MSVLVVVVVFVNEIVDVMVMVVCSSVRLWVLWVGVVKCGKRLLCGVVEGCWGVGLFGGI